MHGGMRSMPAGVPDSRGGEGLAAPHRDRAQNVSSKNTRVHMNI